MLIILVIDRMISTEQIGYQLTLLISRQSVEKRGIGITADCFPVHREVEVDAIRTAQSCVADIDIRIFG